MSLKSPLGRVLGLGAAGGSHHWWLQRLSSIALVPLTGWFVVALLTLPDLGWVSVHAWLAKPPCTVLLLLLVPTLLHHSWLGVTVVVEDYVHSPFAKTLTLLGLQMLHLVLGAAALYAVLKIAFGGTP
jgi:succinate dehydrogenase / fumarate reductase membrane anchor subunit